MRFERFFAARGSCEPESGRAASDRVADIAPSGLTMRQCAGAHIHDFKTTARIAAPAVRVR
jgi:hypothetical protein